MNFAKLSLRSFRAPASSFCERHFATGKVHLFKNGYGFIKPSMEGADDLFYALGMEDCIKDGRMPLIDDIVTFDEVPNPKKNLESLLPSILQAELATRLFRCPARSGRRFQRRRAQRLLRTGRFLGGAANGTKPPTARQSRPARQIQRKKSPNIKFNLSLLWPLSDGLVV
jgi:hypothetical protein